MTQLKSGLHTIKVIAQNREVKLVEGLLRGAVGPEERKCIFEGGKYFGLGPNLKHLFATFQLQHPLIMPVGAARKELSQDLVPAATRFN